MKTRSTLPTTSGTACSGLVPITKESPWRQTKQQGRRICVGRRDCRRSRAAGYMSRTPATTGSRSLTAKGVFSRSSAGGVRGRESFEIHAGLPSTARAYGAWGRAGSGMVSFKIRVESFRGPDGNLYVRRLRERSSGGLHHEFLGAFGDGGQTASVYTNRRASPSTRAASCTWLTRGSIE
jgi:hypothetical protein